MSTSFAASPDGCRIAYDVGGTGVPIVLLHGGGYTRQDWHNVGYTSALKSDFQVITLDIRGNGESDKPIDTASYTTDKHCQDIIAVADACDVERFMVCGFSYGGNIGRYLAAQSARVSRLVMMGIPFGLGASGDFRQFIIQFRDHWYPIMRAQADGTLDTQSLLPEDQSSLRDGSIPVTLAGLSAMLDWAPISPKDLLCATLWLVGSRNVDALSSIKEYRTALKKSKVKVQIVDGLDHRQEFSETSRVLPIIRAFCQA